MDVLPCWIKAMQDPGVNLGLEWPTTQTEPLVTFCGRIKTNHILHHEHEASACIVNTLAATGPGRLERRF